MENSRGHPIHSQRRLPNPGMAWACASHDIRTQCCVFGASGGDAARGREYVLNSASGIIIQQKSCCISGRCSIKSVATGLYLGWETGNDSITKVVKTNLPIVKSINLNGYTYSYVGVVLYNKTMHYSFYFR